MRDSMPGHERNYATHTHKCVPRLTRNHGEYAFDTACNMNFDISYIINTYLYTETIDPTCLVLIVNRALVK